MLKNYKEFKEFVEDNPDLVSGLIECDGSMQEAYADYLVQKEINILKKENQILRGIVMDFERKAHPRRMIHFRPNPNL